MQNVKELKSTNKQNTIIRVGLETFIPSEILQIMAGYKAKLCNYTEFYRTTYLIFEGKYSDLERMFDNNEFCDTSTSNVNSMDSFEKYILKNRK